MQISNTTYLAIIKSLKNNYAGLPLYKRFWFSLWSYSFSSALSNVDEEHPTSEQVEALLTASDQAWFFKSIFGLFDCFKQAISDLSYINEPFLNVTSGLADLVLSYIPTDDLVDSGLKSSNGPFFWQELNLHKFLAHLVHGEYAKVRAMLLEDITLLIKKGTVTDYSGRAFTSISGFEYALWALDKHMWKLMLDCLPQNGDGARIKQTLLEQYRKVKDKGATYRFDRNPPVTESHFDFQNTIIKELKTQVESYYVTHPNYVEIERQWREGVGGAQKLLPMHVIYEYCSDVSFETIPTFSEQPILKKHFSNWVETPMEESWFHRDSKLGVNFGIIKAYLNYARGYLAGIIGLLPAAYYDLLAITRLSEVRTNEFNDLEQQLESNLVDTPDVAPQRR